MADYTTQNEPTVPVTLVAGDLEIGAVEIKNATSDVRAVVQAASSAGTAVVGLATADGNIPAMSAKLPATIEKADAAMDKTQTLVTNLNGLVEENRAQIHEKIGRAHV